MAKGYSNHQSHVAIKTKAVAQFLAAIWSKHHCQAVHRETVFVREMIKDQAVWEGDVEVFDLGRHEKKVCYAWQHTEGNGNETLITVLGSLSIDSPCKAIRAAALVSPGLINERLKLKQTLTRSNQLLRHAKVLSEDLEAVIVVARQIADECRINRSHSH